MRATTSTQRMVPSPADRAGAWLSRLAAVAALLVSSTGPAHAQAPEPYRPPPLTDEDRAAAFPDVGDMDVREMMTANPLLAFLLFDQLEARDASDGTALSWELTSWVGRALDLNKLWIRSEGERESGRTVEAELELLWGRSFARWWDFVAGVRQDFRPGPSRSWAAVGVQGLAPYRFELEATAYLGEAGQAAARIEAEYELLITNRLILQPRVEFDWFRNDDPRRGIGSGLAEGEAGLRLRYEFRREVAPYIGIVRERKFGNTAALARAAGADPSDTRLVVGIRLWF